jgi:cytochrome c2/cytochrome c553
MRLAVAVALVAWCAACGEPARPAAATRALPEEIAAELGVARAGCVRCHEAPAEVRERMVPVAGPDLASALRWRANDGGAAFLRQHHGGDDAADLAAYVIALGGERAATASVVPIEVAPAAIARGERLVNELACGACHAPQLLAGLSARTDHATLTRFLAAPHERLRDVVHPPLSVREASDVAAHLLRAQGAESLPEPGFAWACFHQRIDDDGLPELDGRAADATGVSQSIDAKVVVRERHYALRFDATLDVPAAGEWTFTTGSDDSSWLWIDGEPIVRNEALAPHRRKNGTVRLDAGAHALRVVYTQAAGERSLEVLWQGPGTPQQPIPAERASAQRIVLAPPSTPPMPGADAIARGRAAARARRCDACHRVDDDAFAALPAPPPARAWHELRDAPCPATPAGQGLRQLAATALQRPPDDASRLELALLRDGCRSCHVRDGRGGVPPAVRPQLAHVEDIGDEGRLPPDLTAVGRRLRPAWLHDVLANGTPVRPYLRVRMPKLGEQKAREYAALFAAVDGASPGDDVEPPFSLDAVELGRQQAGTGGRNCVTCHRVQGHPSPGVQGMDLAVQHARLRPAWFREWLLHPTQLRPGTRMPTAWFDDDAAARAEVDAIRTWLSLGVTAPLPRGIGPGAGSLQLVPVDRLVLHGAFLAGVSARCLCVGTRERTHFAYDLATARLVWLWRGDFVDAGGTWTGRAGKLLKPAGTDWLVLTDFTLAGDPPRQLLGQRRTTDGYPVLRVAAGEAEYQDEARARLVAGGSEIVRTLRGVRGNVVLQFAPAIEGVRVLVGSVPAERHELAAGRSIEVTYRW